MNPLSFPPRARAARVRLMRHQHGQSMTEFLVIAPLLLFFCLATVQFALLYQAKSTLDAATLEAAREGAVTHGSMTAMQDGLARGLAPLYARHASADGAQAALLNAQTDVMTASHITIVSPTADMVSDFAPATSFATQGTAVAEIPNDTLIYRNTVTGPRSGVNIQDANLLKIRVHYCYDMYVPLVNKVLYYAANVIGNIGPDGILPREPADGGEDPYGDPQQPDTWCRVKLADGIATGKWPLALESEALVRMQSSYRPSAANDATAARSAPRP
ncbi:hypothetical protein R69919_02431 [Paraburkholderia gardini]|uniref:TadE-like domain-containing protein n=2 Tax=Paraburkholderia gardini TaxID=2823469 RepID=A0ABM8U3M5_9BURK|nr:hypothetical protein R69919_02431 [Paraburkholderia gardini]CAG4898626.1 hypothetical protein R54767_02416 [Paraburkholderia gardini]